MSKKSASVSGESAAVYAFDYADYIFKIVT